MRITGLHIEAGGTYALVQYDPRERDATLAFMQKLVGGWLEAAPIFTDALTMYCNEEGKLLGLPVNVVATLMLDPRVEDVIAGDVLIVGGPDEEGYDTTLPVATFLGNFYRRRG
jgi:hypothetical protein